MLYIYALEGMFSCQHDSMLGLQAYKTVKDKHYDSYIWINVVYILYICFVSENVKMDKSE